MEFFEHLNQEIQKKHFSMYMIKKEMSLHVIMFILSVLLHYLSIYVHRVLSYLLIFPLK